MAGGTSAVNGRPPGHGTFRVSVDQDPLTVARRNSSQETPDPNGEVPDSRATGVLSEVMSKEARPGTPAAAAVKVCPQREAAAFRGAAAEAGVVGAAGAAAEGDDPPRRFCSVFNGGKTKWCLLLS